MTASGRTTGNQADRSYLSSFKMNYIHLSLYQIARNEMIKRINCTLDMYDWIMEGADSQAPRCQNQSESYSILKASYEAIIQS